MSRYIDWFWNWCSLSTPSFCSPGKTSDNLWIFHLGSSGSDALNKGFLVSNGSRCVDHVAMPGRRARESERGLGNLKHFFHGRAGCGVFADAKCVRLERKPRKKRPLKPQGPHLKQHGVIVKRKDQSSEYYAAFWFVAQSLISLPQRVEQIPWGDDGEEWSRICCICCRAALEACISQVGWKVLGQKLWMIVLWGTSKIRRSWNPPRLRPFCHWVVVSCRLYFLHGLASFSFSSMNQKPITTGTGNTIHLLVSTVGASESSTR